MSPLRRTLLRCLVVLALAAPATVVLAPPASAATVFNLTLSGGTGTALVGTTLYAREGGVVRVSAITSSDTQCLQLSGAFTSRSTLGSGRASWVLTETAGAGDGVRTVTATAFPGFDASGCTGTPQGRSASFVLDNTGPVVTGTATPAPNAAGWNATAVDVAWSATDAGSGVATGPTPATDTQQADTAGVTKTATATDRLGNTGHGTLTVKVDKSAPTITGSRSPSANLAGWNNSPVTVTFTCADGLSGIADCPAPRTLSTNGADQSVTGTAVDVAGATATATVGGISIDDVPPTLSGVPTTGPGADGWYRDDVTIRWTAEDALSGLDGDAPPDTVLTGEGVAQSASATVTDRAGNTTGAASTPVRIDRTPPVTRASAPDGWTSGAATVTLDAADGLSGVAATSWELDGGSRQEGTSVEVTTEGVHTLRYWSVDRAGNTEPAQTVEIKVDATAPRIRHTLSPAANDAGWNDSTVTVTFTCEDGTGSGVVSCTPPRTVETEGRDQDVPGTATDAAGNTATDPATVSVDTTAPAVRATPDGPPGAGGWYDRPVRVTFRCDDELSGVDRCPAPVVVDEGRGGVARGTAADVAGNTATATAAGIDVDLTPPVLTGAPVTGAGRDGWHSGDVAVRWTASDALSGVDAAPLPDSVVTGEGDDLAVSATVGDAAGNTTTTTVRGLRIDRTPPSTAVSLPATTTGWYADAVEVTLTPGPDLSGVVTTSWSLDGGPERSYDGPFRLTTPGLHTVTFWSTDRAGNVEDRTAPGRSVTVQIDGVPPVITGSRFPAPNANGWNDGPVTVTFTCADEGTGVAACPDPTTVTAEGARQSVTGQAVDGTGATSEATVGDISIDTTPPTVTGTPTTNPNAFGWYRGDVVVRWAGQDGLSGVDTTTQPADTVVEGEGTDLTAGPATLKDRAGNAGSGTVRELRIDRTPPTITGRVVDDDGAARSPNEAGWFSGAVRVRFTCDDALSGVQECASDTVLTTDGDSLTATGTATDRADNAATAAVRGLQVDSRPPTTRAALQCAAANGWCRGGTATVALTAVDQPGLSGVDELRWSTDGGTTWRSDAGADAVVTLPLNGSGAATLKYFAVDAAGNRETANGVEVRFDTIAPAVTHTVTPVPNAAGWNRSDATVSFSARDDSDGSSVDPATVTPDRTVSEETTGLVVRGSAADRAGNVGTDAAVVKLDRTAPTVTASATGTRGTNGWYTSPVTVAFDCADGGSVASGIATCTPDVVLSTDGAGQTAAGRAVDSAGNAATTSVTGVAIDSAPPVITRAGASDGRIYVLGDPAIPTDATACVAADLGSGVASCDLDVSGGRPNGVGTFTFTATATDRAGNASTRTGSFRVVYRWDGFRQPISDTAHQLTLGLSVFKGGSSVPAKFQLKRADGTVVQASAPPQWVVPTPGSPIVGLTGELLFTEPETTGTTYRWDAGGQQYAFTWSTRGAQNGLGYRVGVTLDDGQTHWVTIGLR